MVDATNLLNFEINDLPGRAGRTGGKAANQSGNNAACPGRIDKQAEQDSNESGPCLVAMSITRYLY